MTVKRLRDRIGSLCTHVLFDYNGKACGVDPFVDGECRGSVKLNID